MRQKETSPNFEAELDAYTARRAARSVDWNAHLRRWPVYAAATGAAFAMTTSAEASMISGFSGQKISINGYAFQGVSAASTRVSFSGLGHINLELITSHQTGQFVYSHSGRARIFGNGGTQVDVKSAGLARFSSGQAITNNMARSAAGSLHFDRYELFISQHIPIETLNYSFWPSQKAGFAGFKLANGDLGWIQLAWGGNGVFATQLEALNWEVNTTPGASITAEEPVSGTPEPGTFGLALLAAGAAGVTALRKRRESKA